MILFTEYKNWIQLSHKYFFSFFLKLLIEVESFIDFGSPFHSLAPRKLKERCPVDSLHFIRFKSSRCLVALLCTWERFLNFWERYSRALLLRHWYILTQSFNFNFWAMFKAFWNMVIFSQKKNYSSCEVLN